MTTTDELALEALILSLLRGYPSSASSVSRGLIDSYVSTLSVYDLKSVRQACDRFAHGEVERSSDDFAPSAASIAKLAAMFDAVNNPPPPGPKLVSYPIGAEPPPGTVPLGPTSVDFGQGNLDLSTMHPRDKEFVFRHKRLPEPGETKRIGVVPKLQRMGV